MQKAEKIATGASKKESAFASRHVFPAAAEFVPPHDPVKATPLACALSPRMSQ
jgi:hypothetical protein